MPRDVAGNYTLPAGNPVTPGTVISTTWANTTLTDLSTAMTGSLARNGDGSMTGQFKAVSGTIGSPGISWESEISAGMYRAGAADFRFAVGGADILGLTAVGISSPLIRTGNGTLVDPSFSWASETTAGWYRAGAGNFRFAIGAADILALSSAGLSGIGAGLINLTAANITAGGTLPALNGSALTALNGSAIATGTVADARLSSNVALKNTNNAFSAIQSFPAGAVGAPAFNFSGDPATGWYSAGAGTIVGSISGAASIGISTPGLQVVASLGVGTAPSGTTGEIRATNNITAFFSDMRLKDDEGTIENALAKVESLRGFYYRPNATAQALGFKPTRDVGVSAQDVQAILPDIIRRAPIDEKYMTLDYGRLVPLLIEAVKELADRVRVLGG